MKIAFIGAGHVGAPLAARLAEAGHDVVLAGDGLTAPSTLPPTRGKDPPRSTEPSPPEAPVWSSRRRKAAESMVH